MKQIVLSLVLLLGFQTLVTAQNKTAGMQVTLQQEIETALVETLKLDANQASMLANIETNFFNEKEKLQVAAGAGSINRNALHKLQLSRLDRLNNAGLTGRKLEDVLAVTDVVMRKRAAK